MAKRITLTLIGALTITAAAGKNWEQAPKSPSRGYAIPVVDLSNETHRQVIVDKEPGQLGTYDDIAKGREGQYRVCLLHNTYQADCAYPGVELLPDDTFVATTYGHWIQGEQPFIVSIRFTLKELDARLKAQLRMH